MLVCIILIRRPSEVMHLNQLRKARVISFIYDEMKVLADRGMTEVREVLSKAEHFMFTAIPDDDEEIQASAAAMKQAGVWKLPYPVTTFEFEGFFKPTDMKSNNGHTLRKFEPDASHVVIIVAMEEAVNREGHTVDMAIVDYVRWIFVRHISNKLEWLNMAPELPHVEVRRIFSALMVALHTKGVMRERWSGDHKILSGRKEPANAYTRVMIRETTAAGHGTAVVGDRHRVRLHLRRGHMRQQPYGKGRQHVRLQWIAPMLVGYADEGVVEHEAYVVKERHV